MNTSFTLKVLIPLIASLIIISCFTIINAATFDITNQCSYTVWAAASPGGGKQLDPGQSWQIDVPAGTRGGRVWGRTNCNFDSNGQGQCETGDCGGVLVCTGYGAAPNTLAEYTLTGDNNMDTVDISVVAGFNIPLEFGPTTEGTCKDIECSGPIIEQCPAALQTPGGCNNPCTVYNTNEYCCTDGQGTCGPTPFSEFFKNICPDAYSYPQDDPSSTFTCPVGTNYNVVFCP